VLRYPRAGLRPVDGLRQFRRQQGEQLLVVDPPGGQGIAEGAVAAGELRLRGQLYQRCHRVVRAQDGVRELEQRVRPGTEALIQRLPELPQPFQRPVPRNGAGEDRRVRKPRGRWRQGRPGSRKRLQPGTGPWQAEKHGRFLS
jgi:hypothetical protein